MLTGWLIPGYPKGYYI